MISVGRVVVKIAGRDAGQAGVIVKRDGERVLIDGEVRRREVSIEHIEALADTVEIAEGASTADVRKAMEAIGYEFPEERANKREHKVAPRPRQLRAADRKAAPKAAKPKKAKAKSEKAPAKKPAKKSE